MGALRYGVLPPIYHLVLKPSLTWEAAVSSHNGKISLTNSAISCYSDREDLSASTAIWVVGAGWPWEINLSWMAWPPGSPWDQNSGRSCILQYFAPTMAAGSQVKKERFFPFCSFLSWLLSATLARISQLIWSSFLLLLQGASKLSMVLRAVEWKQKWGSPEGVHCF